MTTLTFQEQNILLWTGAQSLADKTGTNLDDAWDQMSRYQDAGKLSVHGNADRVFLSADGHQLAEANRDLLRLAATPANNYTILAAFSEWICSLPKGGGSNVMSAEAEHRVTALLDELDQGDELDRNQAKLVRELKNRVRQ